MFLGQSGEDSKAATPAGVEIPLKNFYRLGAGRFQFVYPEIPHLPEHPPPFPLRLVIFSTLSLAIRHPL